MRLIDADAYARWLDKNHYVDKPTGKCDDRQNRVLGIAISAVKNPEICPTIDAVPVVRCKDCKRFVTMEGGVKISFCDEYGGEVTENDYCSRAKRRESNAGN